MAEAAEGRVKLTKGVLRLLKTRDMCVGELAVLLSCEAASVRRVCSRMSSEPVDQRAIHIVAWRYDFPGERDYWRPVFRIGPGENCERPAAKPRKDIVREYEARLKLRFGSNAFGPVARTRREARARRSQSLK